jgi:hypothetical protein
MTMASLVSYWGRVLTEERGGRGGLDGVAKLRHFVPCRCRGALECAAAGDLGGQADEGDELHGEGGLGSRPSCGFSSGYGDSGPLTYAVDQPPSMGRMAPLTNSASLEQR